MYQYQYDRKDRYVKIHLQVSNAHVTSDTAQILSQQLEHAATN